MELELESGVTIKSPTEADLSRIEGEEFAILSHDPDTYMQCARVSDVPWEYVLEYQVDSTDEHFSAAGGPIGLDRVLEAFRKYLNNDETWMTDFEWERMELP